MRVCVVEYREVALPPDVERELNSIKDDIIGEENAGYITLDDEKELLDFYEGCFDKIVPLAAWLRELTYPVTLLVED